jgi:DNA-directed RNA polymerase specialized sigma subunit
MTMNDETIEAMKNYLYQVKDADKMIDVKQKRLDELRLQATCIRSPDYSSERIQTSPTGDAIPRIIAKIIDLQEEINADIDRFVDLKAEIMHNIDKLPKADERVVLYAKYFEYKTIQQIADEIPCCRRTVQRVHKTALKKLSLIVTPNL